MEDRFKFRAWYKPLEIILSDFEFHNTYTTLGTIAKDNKYILMQCTGLKDKNGKLIYEGDILKVVGKQTEEITGCVQWLDDFCKFSLNIANSKEGKYQSCETFCEFDYLPETEREIIGNIYENKELFEEQKWK